MTIAVDWDIKIQSKLKTSIQRVNSAIQFTSIVSLINCTVCNSQFMALMSGLFPVQVDSPITAILFQLHQCMV